MTEATFKTRLEPYISLKVFGLTFGGLVALSLLGTAGLALTSGQAEIDTNVTIPLGASNSTVEDMSTQEAGNLNAGDLGGEPGHAAATADLHPEPPKPVRAPIEDAIAGLHESTPFGMVPIIRKSDGMTAFKGYRREFTPSPTARGLISLVMVDYGLSKTASDAALQELPEGTTLALSAYSTDAQKMTTSARQKGHEVWLGLPVQSSDFGNDDSGNQTILVNASVDQNKSRLLTTLGKATGYVGVIDMDTPAFTDNAADLDSIYTSILDRGLALAQGNPKDTLTGEFAITHKAPFVQNDMWIDQEVSKEAVNRELAKLQQIALNGGTAVGFFHPYPAVVKAINDWQDDLAKDQIELAPLSAVIEQKSR